MLVCIRHRKLKIYMLLNFIIIVETYVKFGLYILQELSTMYIYEQSIQTLYLYVQTLSNIFSYII